MEALGISKLWFKPVDETEWHEVKGAKVTPDPIQAICGTPVLDTKKSFSMTINLGTPRLSLSRAQKRCLRRKYGRKQWRNRYIFQGTLLGDLFK